MLMCHPVMLLQGGRFRWTSAETPLVQQEELGQTFEQTLEQALKQTLSHQNETSDTARGTWAALQRIV